MLNVLFICGKNRRRSPTAEHLFAAWPGVEVASAGLSKDADVQVTPEHVREADVVFVMERAHRTKLVARLKPYLGQTRVVCLDIRDNYEFMDEALVELLLARVPPHLAAGS